MTNVAALLFEDCQGSLLYRLKTRAGAQVTAGVTVVATLTLAGVSVIGVSPRDLTYDVSATLSADDDEFGAWACDFTAAELADAGDYTATITVSVVGITVHTTVLRIPVVPDTGGRRWT